MGDGGPGCFDRSVIHPDITDGQVFGWEVVMTFTLISCVYACGVAKPGHGSHTPYAVGLALLCCAGSGGQYTGAALNPARVIGPRAVFLCGQWVGWIYIVAHITAAVLACSVFVLVSGLGPLNPYASIGRLGLTVPESCWMWVTGLPPKRLRQSGKDNVLDIMLAAQAEKARIAAGEGQRVPLRGGDEGQSSVSTVG